MKKTKPSYKTPAHIAEHFTQYCSSMFNDSILAEQWKLFADAQLQIEKTNADESKYLQGQEKQSRFQVLDDKDAAASPVSLLGEPGRLVKKN